MIITKCQQLLWDTLINKDSNKFVRKKPLGSKHSIGSIVLFLWTMQCFTVFCHWWFWLVSYSHMLLPLISISMCEAECFMRDCWLFCFLVDRRWHHNQWKHPRYFSNMFGTFILCKHRWASSSRSTVLKTVKKPNKTADRPPNKHTWDAAISYSHIHSCDKHQCTSSSDLSVKNYDLIHVMKRSPA